jgi:hypothetical protein
MPPPRPTTTADPSPSASLSSTAPSDPGDGAPPVDATADLPPPHAVLGRPTRVQLHRHTPDREGVLDDPRAIGALVAALSEQHVANANVPRAQPAAEVVFLDANGSVIANAVFVGLDGPAMIQVGDRGARTLSSAEISALRGALDRL